MTTDPQNRLRIALLCAILAPGLIAAAAGGPVAAQAQTWMTPPAGEPTAGAPVEASAKANGELTLLSKSGLSLIEISCESLALEDGLLEIEGKSSGKALLAGCSVGISGKAASNCNPTTPGSSPGHISIGFEGQLVMHEGTPYERIEPVGGSGPLVMFEFGVKCALGNLIDVTGSLYAQESNGELEVEAETHPFQEGTSGLGGLLFGGKKASVTGSVSVNLSGTHGGGLWGGLGD